MYFPDGFPIRVSNTGVPSFTFFDEGQATGVPDLLYRLDC
jgi:hypothetical protein